MNLAECSALHRYRQQKPTVRSVKPPVLFAQHCIFHKAMFTERCDLLWVKLHLRMSLDWWKEERKLELELCIVKFFHYKFKGIYTVLYIPHSILSTRKNITEYLWRDVETDVGAEDSGISVNPAVHIRRVNTSICLQIFNVGCNLYIKLLATLP